MISDDRALSDWIGLWKDGCAIVVPVYIFCAVLSIVLPGKKVNGYACDRQGVPLQYKLNGLSVLVLVVLGWAFSSSHWNPTAIAEGFWGCLLVSFVLGMLGSAVLFGSGLDESRKEKYSRCSTADQKRPPKASKSDIQEWDSRSMASHFFLGLEFNPRWGSLDIKMYLYVVGATYLALNVLSAAALQAKIEHEQNEDEGLATLSSSAMKVYLWMMGWFLLDYLWFEELHLYTYDLFAEKLGFKLFWGCFCFYPFFYCIGIWSIVGHDQSRDLETSQVVGILILFYCGSTLTRGSNLQKFWFKREREKISKLRKKNDAGGSIEEPVWVCFWGLLQQVPIRPGSSIVCSGFWGLSRHINYLGEILQALAMALPGYLVSGSFVPFLYPLYYVALFVPRAIDDGVVCSNKYGTEWDEYVERVPYKIVPWIY